MYLIDTNIILEFLLGQDKADECINLIESFSHKKIPIFISRFGLYTIEIIMLINKKQESLAEFLNFLMSYSNIRILSTDANEDKEIIKISDKHKLDFDDALHYYLCTRYNLKLISFDKHFDKTDIVRVEPKDLLI